MQPQNDLLNIRGPNLIKFRLPKSAIWTIWDYCDISDSVDHEREAGIKYDVTDQQIFLNSFKDSFVFAIPAGLIGLGCGFAVFGTDAKIDSAPEQ